MKQGLLMTTKYGIKCHFFFRKWLEESSIVGFTFCLYVHMHLSSVSTDSRSTQEVKEWKGVN